MAESVSMFQKVRESGLFKIKCNVFIYSLNPNLVKNACPRLEILVLETKASTTLSITSKTLCPSFLSVLSPWTNYSKTQDFSHGQQSQVHLHREG